MRPEAVEPDESPGQRRRVRIRMRTKEKKRLESPRPTRRSLRKLAVQVLLGILGFAVFAFITFRVLDSVNMSWKGPPKKERR